MDEIKEAVVSALDSFEQAAERIGAAVERVGAEVESLAVRCGSAANEAASFFVAARAEVERRG